MAPHSSTLAWKIPWTEEPGRLQSMDMAELLHFHFYALEKEMATHSSVLAWRIPGTVEPGGLPSVGLHRVGHDWSDLAAAVAVLNGGEGHGNPLQYSSWKIPWTEALVGYSPWGLEELDTTEWRHFHFHALEKEMATHSSVLAWGIPGTGEPGGLPSIGSPRVGHGLTRLAATVLNDINFGVK